METINLDIVRSFDVKIRENGQWRKIERKEDFKKNFMIEEIIACSFAEENVTLEKGKIIMGERLALWECIPD